MPGPGTFLVGEEERRHVAEVMATGYLSRYGVEGDPRFLHKVVTLEQLFAERFGTRHVLAVSGGTGAIMASLVALGVGPGVEVLVPGYTFVASISAVLVVGGIPVLAEIDESLTMDPADLEGKITGRTRVIMPVHMLGNPSAMDAITAVAKRHGLARARGLGPGARRDVPREVHRNLRRHRRLLAEPQQDDQLRRRRPRRHRRHRALRAGLRVPRPGPQAAAHGPRDREALDPRRQPPHERAHRAPSPSGSSRSWTGSSRC